MQALSTRVQLFPYSYKSHDIDRNIVEICCVNSCYSYHQQVLREETQPLIILWQLKHKMTFAYNKYRTASINNVYTLTPLCGCVIQTIRYIIAFDVINSAYNCYCSIIESAYPYL